MPLLFTVQTNSLLLLLLIWAFVSGELKDYNEPKVEPLLQSNARPSGQSISFSPGQSVSELPIFPERSDAVYFVVAVPGGAKSWGRALARTLLDMGTPFSSPQGPPLRPIYVDLPTSGRFSAKVLTTLCDQVEGVPLSGMIVVGDGQAARSIALSGNAMKVPVLWAKGGTAQLHAGGSEAQNFLQATLQPSAKEILQAIRAIFLQTHWHSFFVLSDIGSTMVLGSSLGGILKKTPLSPTILPLSSNKDDVFRQLAKISRSTRGIVLLLCDLNAARSVMSEAQRLKMTGGHFIWIWADTSSTAEFFQPNSVPNTDDKDQMMNAKGNYEEFNNRKKAESQIERHQGGGGSKRQQNNTRYKSSNNNNRFQQIIGLNEDDERTFFTDGQVPLKVKRFKQNLESNDYTGSVEKHSQNNLKIKNIESKEFNANYYDPYSIGRQGEDDDNDSSYGSDLNESTNIENNYETFDKINPYESHREVTTSAGFEETTRRPKSSDVNEKTQANNNKNTNRNHRNDGNNNKPITPTVSAPKIFDDNENLDLEVYTEASNDLKAKRADNSPSTFNISSHVFFHHFKDFPVGLLALRHIKMNIDRVFVRAAVRLFASTWNIVEKDEELRTASGGKFIFQKINWDDDWSDNDYDDDEIVNNFKATKKLKSKGNQNVNNRHMNARGSRKYKRDVQLNENIEASVIQTTFVNSRNKSSNSNTKVVDDLKNKTNLQHVSDLNSHPSDDVNKSNKNNKNITSNSNTPSAVNVHRETIQSLKLDGRIDIVKRQNSWWSNIFGGKTPEKPKITRGTPHYKGGCFGVPTRADVNRSEIFARYLREAVTLALSGRTLPGGTMEKNLISNFEILNLVPTQSKARMQQQHQRKKNELKKNSNLMSSKSENPESTKWRRVGLVLGRKVHLDTIVWPGGDIVVSGLSTRARSVFRVVTSLSPPFVMESNLDEDGMCLRGLPCHRLSTSGKHNLTLMFNSIETKERFEEDAVEHGNQIPLNEDHKSSEKVSYKTRCCYGLSMDLLDNVASELGFGYIIYIVSDELFGSKQVKKNFQPEFNRPVDAVQEHLRDRDRERDKNINEKSNRRFNQRFHDQSVWNGIVGDLVVGSADMSFAPLSVSKSRAEVIDFSAPYFHSGVSLLAAPKVTTDIPLLAFLMPFSPELWIAIFIWLNLTAVAVAIYEWLSPFGLNPWGRQRSKNFSLSSALWVMWGLLCGHLVAFKAPKSWPNKFLINVWGGFSVIFIASYTANIAALIAGLFFHNAANTYDTSLMNQRVGIPRSSAAESYVQHNDKHLWEKMKKYTFSSIEDGIIGLKNGSIDLLMADSPILDYYRGSDLGCNLRKIGENYVEDTYAIGMSKGFPLKESISALIAKYSSNGYLDILVEKWHGGLPCYRDEDHIEIVQPRPLGVAAVAGVYLMLGLGMILGVLILIFEHMFFKYYLPILRHQPKGSVWRSRNIMFFSQKLYRFINCVELVSPHHAARELVHTLRKGHITSLFQKSVKRKEDEQRRRRKSKAQFFEMIQEIRRVQQEEKEQPVVPTLAVVPEVEPNQSPNPEIQSIASSVSSVKPKASPKLRIFSLKRDGRSRSNSSSLNVRRFSTDSIMGERLDTIGRRLSRDIASDLANSPPDLGHRFETFGKTETTSKFDTFSGKGLTKSADDLDKSSREKNKFDTFSGVFDEAKPALPAKKNPRNKLKRKQISKEIFESKHQVTFENQSTLPLRDSAREVIKESYRESLHPAIFQLDSSKAVLRDKLHEELKQKYGKNKTLLKAKPPKAMSSSVQRSQIKSQNPNDSFLKVQSNDSLNVRPVPSPRSKSRNYSEDDDDDEGLDPTYATIQPRNKSPRVSNNSVPLGRLSKEDLLNLSSRTESEIHEFLNGKPGTKNSKTDPP
ncbi:CLUMA_CG008543, isoform A [Clunio marinus]|uniref:CLUMA_CG008543, isoform A n=1 Tax=Clunio marinus TaxID=568069 RepID=A0A1J1I9F7_9DIPT|nr:CLUMA_CG008543, isoform A [Clunio marinus]